MDTTNLHPVETIIGQSYCITTDIPCTVLAELKGRAMPLLRVLKGQGIFIAPTPMVYLTADAHITKSFKGAAPAVQGGGDKEITEPDEDAPKHCTCEMAHQRWAVLPRSIDSVKMVINPMDEFAVSSMVLEIAPSELVMPTGWLTAQTEDGTPVTIRWIAGEPTLPATGLHYIIGLTQRTPTLILANLLATY